MHAAGIFIGVTSTNPTIGADEYEALRAAVISVLNSLSDYRAGLIDDDELRHEVAVSGARERMDQFDEGAQA